MNHCKDCKHFEPVDQDLPTVADGWEPWPKKPDLEYGICGMAASADGRAENKNTKAFARDYELYGANLLVRPDFGCVQFEPKLILPDDSHAKV